MCIIGPIDKLYIASLKIYQFLPLDSTGKFFIYQLFPVFTTFYHFLPATEKLFSNDLPVFTTCYQYLPLDTSTKFTTKIIYQFLPVRTIHTETIKKQKNT